MQHAYIRVSLVFLIRRLRLELRELLGSQETLGHLAAGAPVTATGMYQRGGRPVSYSTRARVVSATVDALTAHPHGAVTATKALLRAAADGPYQLQRAAERRHFSALLRQHSGVANEQGDVKLTGRTTGTRDGA